MLEIDRERLIAWLIAHDMDYKQLAHALKFSPTAIYGALGGAWPFSSAFISVFRQTFPDADVFPTSSVAPKAAVAPQE